MTTRIVRIAGFLITAALCFQPVAFAQRREVAIGFLVGVPQADYKQGTGWGPSFSISMPLGETPLHLGADVMWVINESIPQGNGNGVSTDAGSLPIQMSLRAQTRSGRVQPYVEGLAGIHHLYGGLPVVSGTVCGGGGFLDFRGRSCSYSERYQLNDTTFSYGVGVGAQFDLSRSGWAFLDVRVRYVGGGQADHVREGSLKWVEGVGVTFDRATSHVNLLTGQVGYAVRF